jgi:hypothetical protein
VVENNVFVASVRNGGNAGVLYIQSGSVGLGFVL